MNVNEAIAAVKANPPHPESPLPWRANGKFVENSNGDGIGGIRYREDAAHIAAAVNAAPVLVAEVDRLHVELATLREANRWIAVEDDVPDDCKDVLVWNGEPRQGWLDTDSGWFKDSSGNRLYNVTHWRPMPAPPEVSP